MLNIAGRSPYVYEPNTATFDISLIQKRTLEERIDRANLHAFRPKQVIAVQKSRPELLELSDDFRSACISCLSYMAFGLVELYKAVRHEFKRIQL